MGEINFLLIEIWGLQDNTSSEWITSWVLLFYKNLGLLVWVHPYSISLFKNYIRRSQGERAIFVDPSSIHPLGLPWKDRKVSDFLCSNNAVFLPVSNNSHVMSMINCWERWWWSRKCTFKSDLLYSYLAVLCIQFWQELFKNCFYVPR